MSISKKTTIGPFNGDYRKLIRLPAARYLLEKNGSEYTIHTPNGNVQIKDKDKLKLKWKNDKIVLYDENSALKLNEQDFIVEQDAIISKDKDDIIEEIKKGKGNSDVKVTLENIIGSSYFGAGLSVFTGNRDLIGTLNFINFNDKDDQILQGIVKKTDELYFTTKEEGTCCSEITCISDKNGTCMPMYGNNEYYQFKLTAVDALAMVES